MKLSSVMSNENDAKPELFNEVNAAFADIIDFDTYETTEDISNDQLEGLLVECLVDSEH